MPYSEVDICNIALSHVGAEAISSLTGETLAKRLCGIQYPIARDYTLEVGDWSFARKLAQLRAVVDDTLMAPSGYLLYSKPTDCLVPRDIHPRGTKYRWEELHGYLALPDFILEPKLYYTAHIVSATQFTSSFVQLLSLNLAMRLVKPITGSNTLARELSGQFTAAREEILGTDANRGSQLELSDHAQGKDTFVNPDFLPGSFEEPEV